MAEKRPDETIPDLEHYLLGEARIIRGAINAAGYQARGPIPRGKSMDRTISYPIRG